MESTILVIEDHESLRFLLGHLLSKQQYNVITQKDGMEGLLWISRGNIPDLIILDMSMPRLNGFEFLENIRSSGFFKDIPVIVVSGSETREDLEKCLDYGIHGFFNKPFNPIFLTEKVGEILENKNEAKTIKEL